MTTLQIGDSAPNFTAVNQDNVQTSLTDFAGKKLVLYFYPKDDTPGCTNEAKAFRDRLAQFNDKNTVILGVSRDNVAKHQKFIAKYDLNFSLLADEQGEVCQAYGTWVEKSMFGKKYMGIERATFLIDEQGKIAKIWPKVKVNGHADDVLGQL